LVEGKLFWATLIETRVLLDEKRLGGISTCGEGGAQFTKGNSCGKKSSHLQVGETWSVLKKKIGGRILSRKQGGKKLKKGKGTKSYLTKFNQPYTKGSSKREGSRRTWNIGKGASCGNRGEREFTGDTNAGLGHCKGQGVYPSILPEDGCVRERKWKKRSNFGIRERGKS